LRWPNRILGPTPGLKEINLACWALFAALTITRFCIPVWLQFKAGRGSIPLLPDDFVYFYGIGHIVKEYPAVRLYDYSLQQKIFNGIYPFPKFAYGPSPYPPFVALFFSLFAQLSFRLAFFLWTLVSLVLYMVGIAAPANDIFPGDRIKVSLILCLAVAFYPYFWGILVNGQLTAVAVCSVGLAILQERHAKPFSSGLALSILAYKPTLLLLLLPMLFLTRRYRALAGFMTGTLVLLLVSTAFGGIQIWPVYAHFLSLFGRVAGLDGQRALELWKYIDIGSCLEAVSGGGSRAELLILTPLVTLIAAALAVLLWKSATGGRPAQSLAWAATLTWTLLLNVYMPMYDSVLVTIPVVLTLGALKDLEWNAAMYWMTVLSILIFAVSWVTYAIAKSHGIQLLSISLAVLGLAQLYLLYRVNRKKLPEEASELLQGQRA
jgi:hypothetical protein